MGLWLGYSGSVAETEVCMVDHEFGGAWTEKKLAALKSYLQAYRLIFTQNEKARNFRTIYIDAFAGTGERKVPDADAGTSTLFTADELPEMNAYEKGSARIALELDSPFDEYIFVDKKPDHTLQLQNLIHTEYPELESRCQVLQGDGPAAIRKICVSRNWRKQRAVLFLDPYGMNVEWDLLRLIADTKAIDMWFLFPLGTGANRLLTRDTAPPKSFAEKLTRIFGTDKWQTAFYKESQQIGLFGDDPSIVKDATFDQIGKYLIERLKTIFSGVAPTTKALYNSRNNPMYLLCFAAGNPVGAPTAIKIADHLLGK
jgi:three-Cys-motif partner protein